jgi:hypothetical protein
MANAAPQTGGALLPALLALTARLPVATSQPVPQPSVPILDTPSSGATNQLFSFSGRVSLGLGTNRISWDFGNGTAHAPSSQQAVTQVWAAPGVCTLTVILVDETGVSTFALTQAQTAMPSAGATALGPRGLGITDDSAAPAPAARAAIHLVPITAATAAADSWRRPAANGIALGPAVGLGFGGCSRVIEVVVDGQEPATGAGT